MSISQKIGNTQQIGASYLNLGWFHYQRGEFVKAKEYYEKMFEVYEKWGQEAYKIGSYPLVVLNYIELGEFDRTRTLLDEMHKFAHEKQNKGLIADEHGVRACLLRAERKLNESIELFERSLQEYEALGARKWNVYVLASTFYEYARAYLERNQPGDIEAGEKLLNQALEIYQKLGAKQDIEKVEAKMTFIETGKAIPEPKSIELVPTGYADLDKLLYGGIPPDYAVVLTSHSCNERDMLVKSFLETGVKKGEAAFYVTIYTGLAKALADELTSNFQLFVCNPEANAIIKSSPTVHTLKGVENLMTSVLP